MEALLSRYRNLTVLLVVVVAQLIYLAYQVKTNGDERLIRVWAVTAVTPMAGIVEVTRRNTIGFLEDYFILLDVREQNRRLHADNDRLRMENIYYRNQLSTAVNARALTAFQQETPSRTIAARVIGNSTVATAKAVFIDRGFTSGIKKGMPVVTAEGVVGKVSAAYPLVSQVLLVTDPTFKVGVESQKGHIHGVLNCGTGQCAIEQIQNEDKVSTGEWFYTSGEDRIFPRGFPVGTVVSAQPGQGMKDVRLNLSGAPGGVEEVLVVQEGVHQQIPTAPPSVDESSTAMLPPPPPESKGAEIQSPKGQTQADQIMQKYGILGQEQKHVYGGYGSNLPNFNAKPEGQPLPGGENKAQSPSSPAAAQAPAKAAAPPDRPAVLGARPSAPVPHAVVPSAPARPSPTLPLGAPRRRPAQTQQ
ncbi:MAG TPA: rod shape-determining protein MreC [Bryobacteraceae bacterium]|nr:rod shape-determining protein MreC [Bryobacteraceae bacterium]